MRASSISRSIRGLFSYSMKLLDFPRRSCPQLRLFNLACVTIVVISARGALIMLENKTSVSSEIIFPGFS
ncbi:hypothetical protein AYI68_g192 [Smittium mucronatum]|uniref:Uncharacterized protein n=1 Tax=Smittium mucronatum TaxID=133383 RepID=A0A1R0H911_9FUNG|nr:hypothetical protein AYI68_g192 [Smittium mucronatum]